MGSVGRGSLTIGKHSRSLRGREKECVGREREVFAFGEGLRKKNGLLLHAWYACARVYICFESEYLNKGNIREWHMNFVVICSYFGLLGLCVF